jgi:hypothetical protein
MGDTQPMTTATWDIERWIDAPDDVEYAPVLLAGI